MFVTCIHFGFRPLTQEEIAQRREAARQRLAEKQAASAATAEDEKTDLPEEGVLLY